MDIETFSRFGKGSWGEDRIFSGRGSCGVIDGSTPIDAFETDGLNSQAEWFAQKLKEGLEDKDRIPDFAGACQGICRMLSKAPAIQGIEDDHNLPAATIAAVTESGDVLAFHVLGDSCALVRKRDGSIVGLSDTRMRAFSQKTVEARNAAFATGGDPATAVRHQMIDNRRFMNAPGGFWTVSVKGSFADKFRILAFPRDEISQAMVFTDGFEQLCCLNGTSPARLLDGDPHLIARVEGMWEAMTDTALDCRFAKRIDDASLVLIGFGEG